MGLVLFIVCCLLVFVFIMFMVEITQVYHLGKVVGKHDNYSDGAKYYLHVLVDDKVNDKKSVEITVSQKAYNYYNEGDKILVKI